MKMYFMVEAIDAMNPLAVPWGCIGPCGELTLKFCKRCADINEHSDAESWRRGAFQMDKWRQRNVERRADDCVQIVRLMIGR